MPNHGLLAEPTPCLVVRLFALAQALTNDYDRFEDRVGRST
jgi:hypothetical protein